MLMTTIWCVKVSEHDYLRQVSKTLRKFGWRLRSRKSQFVGHNAHYKGHVISASLVSLDPESLTRFMQ